MKKIASFLGLSALSVSSAMAAVPLAVTASITEAGADAATVAGAVLVVIVALLGFKYMRSQAK